MEVESFSSFSITRVYNKIYPEAKSYPQHIKLPVINASPIGKNNSQPYSNVIGKTAIEPNPKKKAAK